MNDTLWRHKDAVHEFIHANVIELPRVTAKGSCPWLRASMNLTRDRVSWILRAHLEKDHEAGLREIPVWTD